MMVLPGCGRGQEPARAASTAPASSVAMSNLVEVAVRIPAAERIDASIEVPGTFVPWEEATVAAEAAGPITAVLVDENSRVMKGQTLARLDASKAELAVKQAEAALAQARANLEKARGELERKKSLLDDRTIAVGTYETFKAQHDAASAAVDGAETALTLARRRLRDMVVLAPFAGVVKEKKVTSGEYAREGDALIILMQVEPLKLQFELPEKYSGRLTSGQQVSCSVASLPGQEFAGKIRTVFPAASVQSRTVRMEAVLANPGYRLKPGFFALVRVPLSSSAGSLVVPRAAIVRQEGAEHVFVVAGEHVRLARVQTGIEAGDNVEIVSGLRADDRVVVQGADTLRDGDRVKVRS
ncbi:MAG: efflux RND transporter periplasmic adaptor subunit [Acidobacteria bacterium]|nr:efflux RND transporter periplasmic adaptor subunit [Acidobacteriota bacterium]